MLGQTVPTALLSQHIAPQVRGNWPHTQVGGENLFLFLTAVQNDSFHYYSVYLFALPVPCFNLRMQPISRETNHMCWEIIPSVL